ncbi:MAG: hypothetical protein RLZZ314_311, partial [Bacteroidota bacterium]
VGDGQKQTRMARGDFLGGTWDLAEGGTHVKPARSFGRFVREEVSKTLAPMYLLPSKQ